MAQDRINIHIHLSIDIPVFPAPVDKRFEISDVLVNRRTFYFLTSLEYELIKGLGIQTTYQLRQYSSGEIPVVLADLPILNEHIQQDFLLGSETNAILKTNG